MSLACLSTWILSIYGLGIYRDVCAFICLVSGYILLVAGRFMHVREAVGLGKVCLIKNKSHTYVFLLNNYINKNTS